MVGGRELKKLSMSQPEAPGRDQMLNEKSVYLRDYSGELLTEAQELCRLSKKLRNINAELATEMRLIRAVGFRLRRANRPPIDT
jgi:hypothetical protein